MRWFLSFKLVTSVSMLDLRLDLPDIPVGYSASGFNTTGGNVLTIESLKLFSIYLFRLLFLTTPLFALFLSASAFATDMTSSSCDFDRIPEEELASCYKSHARASTLNAATIRRCTKAMKGDSFCPAGPEGAFQDALPINDYINEFKSGRDHSIIRKDAGDVFFDNSFCGIGSGSLTQPKPNVPLVTCTHLARLYRYNGGQFRFNCDAYSGDKKETCQRVVSGVTSKIDCLANVRNKLICESMIRGFTENEHCKTNTNLCLRALGNDSCQLDNYDQASCTGSDVSDGRDIVNSAGADDTDDDETTTEPPGPGGGPEEDPATEPSEDPSDPDNEPSDDPSTDDTQDPGLDGLTGLANNLANRMFGAGNGGAQTGGGNAQYANVDVGGGSSADIQSASIDEQARLNDISAANSLAFGTTLQPDQVIDPGGKQKTGGGNNTAGGPRGGGGGGAFNASAGGGSRGAKGPSKRRRRSGALPYKKYRGNGLSFYGSTGAAPTSAEADKDPKSKKRKKRSNKRDVITKIKGRINPSNLNAAFQTGLSQAQTPGHRRGDRFDILDHEECRSRQNIFYCNGVIKAVKSFNGEALNAKGHD